MDYLNNIPICLIQIIGIILITENLLKEKSDKSTIQKIIIVLLFTIICSLFIKNGYEYRLEYLIIMFITLFLYIKFLFDINIISAFLLSMSISILVTFSQIILIFILLIFKDTISILPKSLTLILINLLGIIISLFLSKIKYFTNITKRFIKKFNSKDVFIELIILLSLTFIIVFFYYEIFIVKYVEGNSINLVIYVITFSFLFFIYIYDKFKYKDLIKQYASLFEYSCTFEEELEKDKLMRHEYKNQLIVIESMSKNRKVKNYVNDIMKNMKYSNDHNIKGLNNLPRGGLRGLIYYKLMIIKNNNINYSLDVSKTVNNKILKLSEDEIKILSYVIGVCSDNAIEECTNSDNSNISIEIYNINDEINVIISNTIVNKICIEKLGIRGYSNKGKGHGNGLYLIRKILLKYPNIKLNTKIINNYYVQEIKVTVSK